MDKCNKQANICYLRIFTTLSVVWIHICSTLIENLDLFDLSDKQISFFGANYQMMCWAVPVFFMITGALLLSPDKNITVNQCLNKYGLRVFIALIVFGVPFAMLKIIMENRNVKSTCIVDAFKAIIENNSLSHLWYLYTLLGIYLILPVLRLYVKQAKEREYKFILFVMFIFDFLLPFLSALSGLNIAFNIPLKYPLYYVMVGYFINKNKLKLYQYRRSSFIVLTMSVILIWYMNYYSLHAKLWTTYDSPLSVIMAMSVFVIFVTMKEINIRNVWKLDRLCFGVYLIHPLFIQFMYRALRITPADFALYPLATVMFFVLFTITAFVTSRLLHLIKPVNKYIL